MTIPKDAEDRIVELRRNGLLQRQIADETGRAQSVISRVLRDAGLRGALGFAPVIDGFEVSQTTQRTGRDGAVLSTSVQQRPAPGPQFAMPEGMRLKGVSVLTDGDDRVKLRWHKAAEAHEDPLQALEQFKAALADWRPASPLAAAPERTVAGVATVYLIGDHHLGMLAWQRETGRSYDLKHAERVLCSAMDELTTVTPPSELGVVLNIGDFFHADGFKNVTPVSGHFLDVDGRHPKVADVAIRLQVHCVERALRKHDRVILVNLEGNHDPVMTIMLRATMRAWYRNEPRVTVDDSPASCWFHQHHKVMLAAHHGHKIRPPAMAGHCAAEQPKMWGGTEYRVAFMGHIHHKERVLSERAGMVVESIGTLAGRDAYSAGAGYHSWRSMSAVSFDRYAEFMRNTASVDPEGRGISPSTIGSAA